MSISDCNRNINLIVFDLDGVLVDSRPLHYRALNIALEALDPKYVITPEQHAATFDGHPTTVKLNMLHEARGLPRASFDAVWRAKQDATMTAIDETIVRNDRLCTVLSALKKRGFTLYVATNAIFCTAKQMLIRNGAFEYIDYLFSNEDVSMTKPHPEIYMKAMMRAKARPDQTLILEDSPLGRQAALASGAHLLPINVPDDVTLAAIDARVAEIDAAAAREACGTSGTSTSNINVLVPIAGRGGTFRAPGNAFPKPLVDVAGKPMIQRVYENVRAPFGTQHFCFATRRDDNRQFRIDLMLRMLDPSCTVVTIDDHTRGAAETCLRAAHACEELRDDEPLMIVNGDQIVDWNIGHFIYCMEAKGIDAGMVTHRSIHPQWSYVTLGPDGFVDHVHEKEPRSDVAVAGIYYFRRGRDFFEAAEVALNASLTTGGEVYLSDVINTLIDTGKHVRHHMVSGFTSMATPAEAAAASTAIEHASSR